MWLIPAADGSAGRRDQVRVGHAGVQRAVAREVTGIVRQTLTPQPSMNENPLQRLYRAGQSIWLDYIDRTMLHDGELARRIRDDALTGMTSNPTIFEKALAEGAAYDEQLAGAPSDLTPCELFELVETTTSATPATCFRRRLRGHEGRRRLRVDRGLAGVGQRRRRDGRRGAAASGRRSTART